MAPLKGSVQYFVIRFDEFNHRVRKELTQKEKKNTQKRRTLARNLIT